MSALYGSIRLTPSNSPFLRSPSPRSPTKHAKEEPCLHLHKSIGTTTVAVSGFDNLYSRSKFAYTAGAAAVVVTVDQDLNITQDFFRAKPNSNGGARDTVGGWPSTPTPRPTSQLIKEGASPLGAASRDWSDSPTGRSSTAKDRIKSATSVALSANGKWLAVGETGYRPRILIFALKEGSSEAPICILSEHSFGVHALSFSPDSRYLASLGTVNDGFLYVWNIEERTGIASLHASNKCTTFINDMTWMGNSIITAGLRFVKIWRPDEDAPSEARESTRHALTTPRPRYETRNSDYGNSILTPKHRVLAGKNSLLGELLDAAFVSVTAISDSKSLLCTEGGEICLLDDRDKMQSLSLAVYTGSTISTARKDDRDMFHVYGANGQTSYLIPDLQRRASSKVTRSPSTSPSRAAFPQNITIAAATLDNAIVTIDSNRSIRMSKRADDLSTDTQSSRCLSAHQDPVLGVLPFGSSIYSKAAFCTYSGKGAVHFWDAEGDTVSETIRMPMEYSDASGNVNEMRTLAVLSDGSMLASGDKFGALALVDLRTKNVKCHIRAHTAEVTALLAFERDGVEFLASASRDRTIQLFMCDGGILDLVQTMDEHAGAVTGLLLSENGQHLMSCSADRSVVVREACIRKADDPRTLAFAMLRAITLKSAPTSMCLAGSPDTILVSSTDRVVAKFSTKTGTSGFSFKCADNENGEAVVLSKILFAPSLNGNPTIVGVSSTDKSVRLYTDYGNLVARDWGHTEGITDAALIAASITSKVEQSASPQIVTVAADSTIFVWHGTATTRSSTQMSDHSNGESASTPTTLGPPLRKVLSHSEISKIRRDRAAEVQDPPSPCNTTAVQPPSPPKVRRKTSRISLAQAPRLEPGFRTNYDTSRRRSLRHRSPSPPSPRNTKKENVRSASQLGMSLRSKSSENVLRTTATVSNGSGFGTITASTDSVCRTLRMYRKKLAIASSNDKVTPDAFKELEKELRLTAKMLSEKIEGTSLDDDAITRVLRRTSSKTNYRVDEKLKSRDDGTPNRNSDSASPTSPERGLPAVHEMRSFERSDTAPGALESAKVIS